MQGVTQIGHPQFAPGARPYPASLRLVGQPGVPAGLVLLRPVYWIAAAAVAGVAFYFGGLASLTIAVAVLIALWAFIEPRTVLWLATAFMIFLFVFFQETAPLGEDLPAEFLFWGIGLALITFGLAVATLFSSQVDWGMTRKRLVAPASLAMFAMLLVILAATVYGLLAGNDFFAVARQLFGCVLFPVYYFVAIALFRTAPDAGQWLRRAAWVVALGSLWYVEKLSFASAARGYYYREQSPLVAYAGAIAVVALCEIVGRRRMAPRMGAAAQLAVCLLAIVLMGSRSTLGGFLATIAALAVMLAWKRQALAITLLVCLLPVGLGVAPYLTTRLVEAPGLAGQISRRFIFELDQDQSYRGRVTQTEVVLRMVNRHPVLGAGMGSENSFLMPDGRRLKVASVDNGWGYLLLKMGYLGLAIFLVLIALLLQKGLSGIGAIRSRLLRADRMAVVAALFYALVTFLSGPVFFHFSASPFFATILGALLVLSEAREPAVAMAAGSRAS